MAFAHQAVLSGLLGLLGLSLLGPGVVGVLRRREGRRFLVAEGIDALNHLRALNAMMAALGALALWALWDLANARALVVGLGVVMAALVLARLYSVFVDGRPGRMTWLYLAIEAAMAAAFLGWPPPAP